MKKCSNCGNGYEGRMCPSCGAREGQTGCGVAGFIVVLTLVVLPLALLGTCALVSGIGILTSRPLMGWGLCLFPLAVLLLYLAHLTLRAIGRWL